MHRLTVKRARLAAAGLLCALTVTAAWAHHSFSAYNMTTTLTASGTIKEFRWGAPHSSMVLIASGPGGKTTQMSILSGTPAAWTRQGFAPRDFHSGDKVQVVYHPNVSGAPGGALATLTTADGRTFRDGEAASAPAVPPAGNPQ